MSYQQCQSCSLVKSVLRVHKPDSNESQSQAKLSRSQQATAQLTRPTSIDSSLFTAERDKLENTQTANVMVFRLTYTTWEDTTWLRQKYSCRITPSMYNTRSSNFFAAENKQPRTADKTNHQAHWIGAS